MRTHRIYLERPVAGAGTVTLDSPAAHHLTRVLRLRPGAALIVFDGMGGEYDATLTDVARQVRITIGSHRDIERESALRLTLAQGVSRGERMDLVMQKATELGVTGIAPLLTDFSVVKLDKNRTEKRWQHWHRVIVGACEQCGRNRLPTLRQVMNLDQWLADLPGGQLRLLLQPAGATRLSQLPQPADNDVLVLVGPEGGLSAREREVALSRDFTAVTLGPRILRTETAALAILAALQSQWGDAG